jgi:hypothetical protein
MQSQYHPGKSKLAVSLDAWLAKVHVKQALLDAV